MLADAGWWPGFGLLWIVLFWGVAVLFFVLCYGLSRLVRTLEARSARRLGSVAA